MYTPKAPLALWVREFVSVETINGIFFLISVKLCRSGFPSIAEHMMWTVSPESAASTLDDKATEGGPACENFNYICNHNNIMIYALTVDF